MVAPKTDPNEDTQTRWSIWDLKKIEKVSERTYRMRIILVSRTNRDGAPKPDLF